MMKKLMLAACLALTLAMPGTKAFCEVVGRTQEDWIHRYTAPNGQEIYYVSFLSEDGEFVTMEDVNFDGVDDVVVLTSFGASNAFYEFYVWDGAQYTLATRNQGLDTGLANYQLYPQQGLVLSHANNGLAGLAHETDIFRWEGTSLTLVRSAVSDYENTSLFENRQYISIDNYDVVHMRVYEAEYDGYERKDNLLWEARLDMTQANDEQALLEQEDAALWQGLR